MYGPEHENAAERGSRDARQEEPEPGLRTPIGGFPCEERERHQPGDVDDQTDDDARDGCAVPLPAPGDIDAVPKANPAASSVSFM